ISADGRYVAFTSYADNLAGNDTNDTSDVFVRDRTAHTTTRVSLANDGTELDDASYTPTISDDGTKVEFLSDSDIAVPDDSNVSTDAFVRDRTAGTTVRADVGNANLEADDG